MLGRKWTGVIAREVLPLVQYRYTFGGDLDVEWDDPERDRSVSVAQVLAPVLDTPGMDSQLVAVCRRARLAAPQGVLWGLAVLSQDRVGLIVHGGVVESTGEHLGVVEDPEAGRYSEYFYLPGVAYPGVVS